MVSIVQPTRMTISASKGSHLAGFQRFTFANDLRQGRGDYYISNLISAADR